MCILLIAIDSIPGWPLVLLGNRDEFHSRPSAPVQPWPGRADCIGGLDLLAGGSWLAQRNDGRFAAVTNLRSGLPAQAPKSRGMLVRDFVEGDEDPESFARRLLGQIDDYGPFNLAFGEPGAVWVVDGSRRSLQRLRPGVHVVSNGPMDNHWPKVERLRRQFLRSVGAGWRDEMTLLALLADTDQPEDADLPQTGVGIERERLLAPIFIRGEHYGTRASSLILHHEDGTLFFRERSHAADGIVADDVAWECPESTREWRLA